MSAQTRLENLVRSKLAGNKIDAVGFTDDLLEMTADVGEITCTQLCNQRLRFLIPSQPPPFEVELDRAVGKLRMLCARLSVLCNESGGQDVSPYGGEGVIIKTRSAELASASVRGTLPSSPNEIPLGHGDSPLSWQVRFKNTMSEQEFTIQAQ
jgi:hypothetical protein